MDKDYQRLLNPLGYNPMPANKFVETHGLTADAVSSMLLLLKLKGLIAAGTCGFYSCLIPETTR